jgi:hypothetical protein
MNVMCRRPALLAAGGVLLAMALLAVVLCMNFARGGPIYAGRTLQQWIGDIESPDLSVHSRALEAVRLIGTNAIPTLSDWMAHRESKSQRRLYQLLESRRVLPRLQWALMAHSEGVGEFRALLGFYALGPRARPAPPLLERLVRETDPVRPAKPVNAARAYVYIDASEAERLVERWLSATNEDLIAGAHRLKSALASVGAAAGGANPPGGANARQPFSSDTNRTSAATASRHSP